MRRRRLAGMVAAVLAGVLAVPGCADLDAAPVAVPVQHPCGPEVDRATARVVDVYAAMLAHLAQRRERERGAAKVLYLVDHAVPEFHPSGVPEWEKRTPAPASTSTAEFTPAVRRCLEGARLNGLPPIRLVDGYDDPAIRSEAVPVKDWPAGDVQPRRYLDGLLFSLGGVPDRGYRVALAASSSNATYDWSGGLFVLQRRAGVWRVTEMARTWVA
jgi:hypothetical protein